MHRHNGRLKEKIGVQKFNQIRKSIHRRATTNKWGPKIGLKLKTFIVGHNQSKVE